MYSTMHELAKLNLHTHNANIFEMLTNFMSGEHLIIVNGLVNAVAVACSQLLSVHVWLTC